MTALPKPYMLLPTPRVPPTSRRGGTVAAASKAASAAASAEDFDTGAPPLVRAGVVATGGVALAMPATKLL